ncbi:MAG: signal peptidase II [Halothiobacillaceae bacterium]
MRPSGAARSPMAWLMLSGIVLVVDQLTKIWATRALDYADPVAILPIFNLRLLHNTGAAFSFLADAGGWQRWLFAALAVIITAALVLWMARLRREERWTSAGLALVIGGALGNLIDRLLYGHVVDFLDFHVGGHHWPAFNIADAAITIGVGILIYTSIRPEVPAPRDSEEHR